MRVDVEEIIEEAGEEAVTQLTSVDGEDTTGTCTWRLI